MRLASGSHQLIDLDASVRIGDTLGAKASTAFSPPEMLAQLDGRTTVRSCRIVDGELRPDGAFELLRAEQ